MQFLKLNKYINPSIIVTFFFLISFIVTPSQLVAQKKYKVVLDAGHGGKDPGNLGSGYQEKKIALKVALLVGKELQKKNDIEVIYTRKKDVFVELHNRAKVANTNKADLFVSIHCDAFHKTDPHGAGTYVLGLRGNKGNLEIAKRENAAILYEDDYKQNYDYDPNSPESLIGLSVLQEENLDESLAIAGLIQNNFVKAKRYNRNVKQDNFLVLRETVMPSVLIELGFLTNKAEGRFLNSAAGQQKMAKAIAQAIERYINQLKLNTVKDIVEDEVVVKETVKSTTGTSVSETKKIVEKIPPKKETPKKVVTTPSKTQKEVQKTISASEKGILYRVQIAASKKYLSLRPYNFKGLENVEMLEIDGYFKYYHGKTSDYESLKEVLKEVKKRGHSGAFIVAFENGVVIPLYKALKKR